MAVIRLTASIAVGWFSMYTRSPMWRCRAPHRNNSALAKRPSNPTRAMSCFSESAARFLMPAFMLVTDALYMHRLQGNRSALRAPTIHTSHDAWLQQNDCTKSVQRLMVIGVCSRTANQISCIAELLTAMHPSVQSLPSYCVNGGRESFG